MPLTELNSPSYDANATLSPDELTVYFSSEREGGEGRLDMYVATRPTPSAPFGDPAPLPDVNTAEWEGWGSLTSDGLFIYATTIDSEGRYGIIGAERASASVPFGEMTSIAALNDAGSHAGQPYVLPDHSAVYFGTTRGGNYDIYRAARTGGGFAAPTALSALDINGPATEHVVAVTPDELTIYFVSRRDGGDDDIYVASRARVADGFGAAVPLSGLNTDGNDFPTWIAPDGCQLLFGSSDDLFVATRTP